MAVYYYWNTVHNSVSEYYERAEVLSFINLEIEECKVYEVTK